MMNTYVIKVDDEVILRMQASSKRDIPKFDTKVDPIGKLKYAQNLASRGASVKAIASRMGSYHSSLELEKGEEPEQEPSGMDKIRAAREALRKKANDAVVELGEDKIEKIDKAQQNGVSDDMNPVTMNPALLGLIEALHGTDVLADEGWVEFPVDDLYVIANIVEVAERLRVRVYLPTDTEQLVKNWVAQQPAPQSGLLEASGIEDDDWRPRLVFERRTADHDWSADPLMDEVGIYLAAWRDDSSVAPLHMQPSYVIDNDPRDVAPASAWLLKGSEASFPTREELRADKAAADVGIFEWHWTTAAQTQIGDLVFFYFLHPRKAIHFVARAASNAYFSKDLPVNADGHVNQAQWWGFFTTPIEIEPIPVAALREGAGGHLPLRGRSGLFLRPDSVRALQIRSADPAHQAELERVVQVPVGLADLPDPADITHAVWRDLAAGALPLEAHVSTHIVEPLLRDALEDSSLTWTREYPIGKRWADFVILDGERPVHVIEVKKVLRKGPHAGWAESRDFKQLRWYANRLGTPGTLIDSHRVVLAERGGDQPIHEITRRGSTKADLKMIHQHIATP